MIGQPTLTRGAPRVCRGIMPALVLATLSITAHAVASGEMPDGVSAALPALGVAAVGIVLSGRQYSHVTIAVLGIAQLAAHVMLSVRSTGQNSGIELVQTSVAPTNGIAVLGAHTLAVPVTAWLVVSADAVLFTMVSTVARLLPMVVMLPPIPETPARLRPTTAIRTRPTAVLLIRSNAHRGPPAAERSEVHSGRSIQDRLHAVRAACGIEQSRTTVGFSSVPRCSHHWTASWA